MMNRDERRNWLSTRNPMWQPRTLHAWFDDLTIEFGDEVVMIEQGRSWTYAEVAAASNRLAAGLLDLNVAPGERVAMLMANYLEFLPLKLAISRVGAIAVPLNFLYRSSELDYALRQSRTNVLVTMASFQTQDYQSMLDGMAPGWVEAPSRSYPDLRRVVVFENDGSAARPGALTLAALDDRGAALASADLPSVAPDTIADLIYTSGTTGSPKGVLVTHDGVLRSSYASALTKALGPGWRALFSMPMYHMFAYTEAMLPALWVGGSVVPRLTFDPADYLRGVQEFGANEILAVPTMTVAILEEAERTTYDLTTLVSVMSAAAAAPSWVWRRVKDLLGDPDIVTGWGMTETSAGIALTRPEDEVEIHATTVGSLKLAGCAGVDELDGELFAVATIDPDTGDRLPEGDVGELIIKSPCVMKGFWEKPDETAAVLLADGWMRSGDLGFVRSDGRVLLTGRAKELYKSGGELIMPKEIEELVTRIPGVSQAYAVGLPDERWGERGCVAIVLEPGGEVSAEQVIETCRQNLARFKVPKEVRFLEAADLPTTPTGKVQKFRLVDMLSAKPTPAG